MDTSRCEIKDGNLFSLFLFWQSPHSVFIEIVNISTSHLVRPNMYTMVQDQETITNGDKTRFCRKVPHSVISNGKVRNILQGCRNASIFHQNLSEWIGHFDINPTQVQKISRVAGAICKNCYKIAKENWYMWEALGVWFQNQQYVKTRRLWNPSICQQNTSLIFWLPHSLILRLQEHFVSLWET